MDFHRSPVPSCGYWRMAEAEPRPSVVIPRNWSKYGTELDGSSLVRIIHNDIISFIRPTRSRSRFIITDSDSMSRRSILSLRREIPGVQVHGVFPPNS